MYVKLFGSIIHSTIWRAPNHVRLVWITMLAMSDRTGHVWASIPGLADASRVTLDECQVALAELMSPDQYSRSQNHEGRRIEVVDGGWRLLNHGHYRGLASAEDRREQTRRAVAKHRAKQPHVSTSKQVQANVSVISPSDHSRSDPETEQRSKTHVASATNADADAMAEKRMTEPQSVKQSEPPARASKPPKVRGIKCALPEYDQVFETAWFIYPKRPGNSKLGAWRAWLKRVGEGVDPLEMLRGTESYALYVERERTEPRYVKQAATFYGPDRHFAADFTPAPEPQPTPAEAFGQFFGVPAARIEALWAEEDAGLAKGRARMAGVA